MESEIDKFATEKFYFHAKYKQIDVPGSIDKKKRTPTDWLTDEESSA
ncbi:MAG: hypothetical protein KJO60_08160 [Desulfofustis sp.]|nr:hypothetical protein [Desulfofustis sp.]MBT8354481.1 hypothetical protein [Desulfofustis sp.]NNK57636.1 hypothetical protein [Desulfofustis sp.]